MTKFIPTPPLPPGPNETSEQYDLMVAGKPYLATDAYLDRLRTRTNGLLFAANNTVGMDERMVIMKSFLACRGGPRGGPWIMNTFTCEYGANISIGDDVFIGPNCTFLDVCPIYIGDRTMIAANTQLYTPSHPILPEERNGCRGPEWASPITIGSDVWIGGGVIILPGVTIGDGSTVGAGSVVTKDVEPRTVVVGNPAKMVKRLPPPKSEDQPEAQAEAKN